MLTHNFHRYYPAAAKAAAGITELVVLRRTIDRKPERAVVALPSVAVAFEGHTAPTRYGKFFILEGEVVYLCRQDQVVAWSDKWDRDRCVGTETVREGFLSPENVQEWQEAKRLVLQEEADRCYGTALRDWEEQTAAVVNWTDDDWAMAAKEKFAAQEGHPVVVSLRDFPMFADLICEPLRIVAPDLLPWLNAMVQRVHEHIGVLGNYRIARHHNLNLSAPLVWEEEKWLATTCDEIAQLRE